jgi:hypothetical protein
LWGVSFFGVVGGSKTAILEPEYFFIFQLSPNLKRWNKEFIFKSRKAGFSLLWQIIKQPSDEHPLFDVFLQILNLVKEI